MEFELTTDLSVVKNFQIGANFEAVSAWLDDELAPYQGMVVQADMIPSAKTYRANLRKVKDRIEAYRKEVKASVLIPYNEFERKAKVLTGKIDAAVLNLDEQIKGHEEREAKEKIDSIAAEYDAYPNDEAKAYCPWDRVFNPKWSNKTYKMDDALAEIKAALDSTKRDLAAIRSMGGENTAYLLDTYRQTHDVASAIRKNNELNRMREVEALRQREEEERRKSAEEAASHIQNTAQKPIHTPEPVISPAVTTDLSQDDLVDVTFRVVCTKAQLKALGQFMKETGIKYGRA